MKSVTGLRSPLRWLGGQSRVAKDIVNCVPEHSAYVEPCCGAAWVFWSKPKELSRAEVLNDLDGELINFYRTLHRRGRRLAQEVDSMPYSRRLFHQAAHSKPRTAFARAVKFWYVNRCGFGGKRRDPSFGVQASRRARVLPDCVLLNLDATVERLRGVVFECVDFERIIDVYDRHDSCFYVSPPYPDSCQAYAVQFGDGDHVRLREVLRRTAGCWLLSYRNCAQVRRLYKGCHRKLLSTRYTLGCNSTARARSEARELLLSNRPLLRRRRA